MVKQDGSMVKVTVIKPDDLNLIPRPPKCERRKVDSCKLSSGLYGVLLHSNPDTHKKLLN